MEERQQRYCIWIGFMFGPALVLGLVIAGFFVPPSPALGADAIKDMFLEHDLAIRAGVWIATAGSPLLAFYVAALSHLLRQILGASSPLITAQTIAGTCLILEFIFPQMIWQAAAYRAERSPELVLMLHDVAWLMYVGVVGTAIAQMLVIAVAIFQDPRSQPLVPRWVAYVCAWCAMGVAGGSLCVFFQTGPLAWNGVIAWWLLVVSFFLWMLVMSLQMHRVSRSLG